MILVPPKTLDFECSAPVEDLPVWGKTYRNAEYDIVPPVRFSKVVVSDNTGTAWGYAGSTAIYRRAPGEPAFSIVAYMPTGATVHDIAVNPNTEWVYVLTETPADTINVMRVNPYAYEVVGPLCSQAGLTNGLYRMTVDTFLQDVFFTGSSNVYKYTNDTGVTSLHAALPGVTIRGIDINPSTKDIFIGADSDGVMKQTASSGAFSEVTSTIGYCGDVCVNWYTGEVFAVELRLAAAEIHVLENGATEFVSLGGTTRDVYQASISWGTLYLTAPNLYSDIGLFSDVSFSKDEYCKYGTRIYLALSDSLNVPPTDTTKWFDYGPTNPGKAIDELLLTRTKGRADDLYISFIGGDIDTIGLFNVVGTNAILRVFDGTGVVSTTTKAITSRNVAFNNVAEGLVYEVNILGPTPSLGGLVAGLAENIGDTLRKVNLELVSYSKVDIDEFGRASFTRRGRAKRAIVPLWAQCSEVDRIYELFNVNDAKFCMWQGDLVTPYLLLYGHYKRFDMPLAHLSGVEYSVEILGDVDTSDEVDPFTYTLPAFGVTRAVLLPDGWTVAVWFSNTAELGPAAGAGFSLPGLSTLTYIAGSEGNVFFFETELYISPLTTPQLNYTEGASAGVVSIYGVDLPNTTLAVGNESVLPEPSIVSATVDATGATLTIVFNTAMTQGAGYVDTDFNLDGSIGGTDIGLTYVSGSGTDTWRFAIVKIIRASETVDLDYNGRPDGVEDVSGNALTAVASFTVVNGSTEDYSDIQSWDGFDGSINGSTYEATNYDYPAFHTAVISASGSLSSAFKVVGSKSLRLNGGAFIFSSAMPSVSAYKGRCGLWVRLDVDIYGGFHSLLRLSAASDAHSLTLTCVNATQLIVGITNNGVTLIPATTVTPYYAISANTWFFIELIWNFETVGLIIRINGDDDHTTVIQKIADAPIPYISYLLGVSNYYGYVDNLIISTDPNRDLYALSLLEACPRI